MLVIATYFPSQLVKNKSKKGLSLLLLYNSIVRNSTIPHILTDYTIILSFIKSFFYWKSSGYPCIWIHNRNSKMFCSILMGFDRIDSYKKVTSVRCVEDNYMGVRYFFVISLLLFEMIICLIEELLCAIVSFQRFPIQNYKWIF